LRRFHLIRIPLCLLLALFFAASSFALPEGGQGPALDPWSEDGWQLTLLCSSDMRGAVLDTDLLTGLSRTGCLLRLSAYAQSLRAGRRNLLLLDAGGSLFGSPEMHFSLKVAGETKPSPVTSLIKGMSYDAVLLGDEDFDLGLDVLRGQTDILRGAGTTLLAANYAKNDAQTSEARRAPWNDAKAFAVYPFFGPDGRTVRVGVIGLSNRTVTRNDLDGVRGVTVQKMLDTWLYYEPELREACDIVIALVHAPIEADERLGWNEEDSVRLLVENTRGIDLVLCGHSVRGGSARIANLDGQITPVISAGGDGAGVTRVDLRLSPETNRPELVWEILDLSAMPVDAARRAVLEPMLKPMQAQLDVKIGTLAAAIPCAQDPYGGSDWLNMIHGSQIWAVEQWARDADADLPSAPISIAYPYLALPEGESLPAGEVRLRDLCRLVTETPALSLVLVNGAELRDFLDELALTIEDNDPIYSLSGLHYLLAPDARAGQRVPFLTHPNGENVVSTDVFAVLVAERGEVGGLLTRYLDEEWLPLEERYIPFEIPPYPRLRLMTPEAYEACLMLAYSIHARSPFAPDKGLTHWSISE